ncbi:MAG: heme-binding domain-containing protein [Bacteriovoracaceae bacterium]|nr:heme-binding domain-containing protein [Bacteroidota bacterium]
MIQRYFFSLIAVTLLVFTGMQFDRPVKNNSNDQSKHLSTLYIVPDSVKLILQVACYDCHSNNTRYPWYAEIQPVGTWMGEHIRKGKKDFNFSEFASYRPRRQYRKLEELRELVQENEMPIPDYVRMHSDARLSGMQKQTLFAWITATHDSMKKVFHPDSLKDRPRR